jgi:RND family efflux transporter MFP subunit
MVYFGGGRRGESTTASPDAVRIAPQPLDVVAPVTVEEIALEPVEILSRHSGMVRPWERYTLGFEIGGRLASLGENAERQPLDEGDRVEVGQVLARLDDRALAAGKKEAQARLALARSNMERVRQLLHQAVGAITEADVQDRETELALAEAQFDTAVKTLEDSSLIAPATGVLTRRLVNVGESINPHQPVFELIENDRMLLVLGVPESKIVDVRQRMREVQRNRTLVGSAVVEQDDLRFKAYMRLVGRDLFGAHREPIVGEVYRVGEAADRQTGLFDVEIALPNERVLLQPGMVGRADLVVARVEGYRVPAASVVFRSGEVRARDPAGGRPHVYVVEEDPQKRPRARRVELLRWVEQWDDIVIVEASEPLRTVVTRGQHRLMDNQRVDVVESSPGHPLPGSAAPPPRAVQAKRG